MNDFQPIQCCMFHSNSRLFSLSHSLRLQPFMVCTFSIVFLSFISLIMRLCYHNHFWFKSYFQFRLRLYHAIIIMCLCIQKKMKRTNETNKRVRERECARVHFTFARRIESKRLNYCTPYNIFIAIIMGTIKLFSFDLKYHSKTSDSRSVPQAAAPITWWNILCVYCALLFFIPWARSFNIAETLSEGAHKICISVIFLYIFIYIFRLFSVSFCF